MKYSINIDQINALDWGLSLSEAAVFTYLFNVPTWADAIQIEGQTFYFAARQKTCQDIPLISDKPDTIYRIYRALHEKGVISYLKHMGRDCMKITEKGKGWNSEKNPSSIVELGKKSESTRKIFRKNSEKNPTYNSTIDNHTILLEEERGKAQTLFQKEIEELKMPDCFSDLTEKAKNIIIGLTIDDFKEARLKELEETQKKERKDSGQKKESEDKLKIVSEVIDYLNTKANTSFKATTKETMQFVLARQKVDGWELEDFKLVIDFKVNDWGKDDRMKQYICPSTLFRASNAEKYMQAAKAWKESSKVGQNGKTKPGVVPLFRQENFSNPDKSKFKF